MTTKRRDFYITTHIEPLIDEPDNWYKYLIDNYEAGSIKYYIWCHEIGKETEKDHWHIYVYFTNPRVITLPKKIWPTGFIEFPKIKERVLNYIRKDGEFIEMGEEPYQGCRNDIEYAKWDIDQMIEKGEFKYWEVAEQNFKTFAKYDKFLTKYMNWKARKCFPTKREVIIYIGAAGKGKTVAALEKLADDYYFWNGHQNSKFWENYYGEKEVLIDDFRGEIPLGMLLRLCDDHPARKYPYVEIKNSSMPWLAEKVVITSNRSINDWFPWAEVEDINAIKRRATIKFFA